MNEADDGVGSEQPRSLAPFVIIWTGQALSLVGSSLVQFSLVWWLTEASGSATVLAMATMMEVLPRIFIGPFAGALVDRWNRRVVMLISDALIALALLVLAILYTMDAVQIWHIYIVMFLRATGGAFHWPAMQASTTLMVPAKHLTRVAGMNQTLQGIVNVVAPPLGALLYELLPMQGIIAIDVGTACLAIGPLLAVSIPQPRREVIGGEAESQHSVLADLREGLSFVWSWPGLVILLIVAAVSNLLGNPAFSLVPLLVSEHFGGDALELGWFQAAFGFGVIAGALTLSIWGGFRRRIITVAVASVLGGVGFIMIGLAPAQAILMAVGIAFFVGFFNPIVNGSLMAMLQVAIPPEMQGRVFTLILSITGLTTPLGLLMAGPTADALGVPAWFVISGIVIVIMSAGQLLFPAIRQIEQPRSEVSGIAGV